MDNFSVIASLMVFGLFLIASPSEAYVVGYIDFSDQRLQSSLLMRQDQPIMSNKRTDQEEDGGIMFGSEDNKDPPLMKPLFPKNEYDSSRNDISYNQVVAENQNGETSRNENEIIYQSDDQKVEDEKRKKRDIMLADAPPNTESDKDVTGSNTILYVQMTSRL